MRNSFSAINNMVTLNWKKKGLKRASVLVNGSETARERQRNGSETSGRCRTNVGRAFARSLSLMLPLIMLFSVGVGSAWGQTTWVKLDSIDFTNTTNFPAQTLTGETKTISGVYFFAKSSKNIKVNNSTAGIDFDGSNAGIKDHAIAIPVTGVNEELKIIVYHDLNNTSASFRTAITHSTNNIPTETQTTDLSIGNSGTKNKNDYVQTKSSLTGSNYIVWVGEASSSYKVVKKVAIYTKAASGSGWGIAGTMNSWTAATNEMTGSGTVSTKISLSANTQYEFKVVDMNTSTWYGNGGTIKGGITGWLFETSKGNTYLRTSCAGDYTFTFDTSTKRLSITYPNSHKVYFDKDGASWSKIYAYSYNDGTWNIGWPGIEITSNTEDNCGTEYYAYTNGYTYIIFNNGSGGEGNQTGDITVSGYEGKHAVGAAATGWEAYPTYTISYNNGGGTGSMSSQSSIACGTDKATSSNTFTAPSGYQFAGWVANVDVTVGGSTKTAGTVLADGVTIQNVSSNITLTAQWEVIPTYDVIYNTNGGTGGSTASQTGNLSGVQVTTSANGFTKTGYKFKWWNTAANGSGEDFYPGEKVTIASSDVNLYAQWEQVESGWELWCGSPNTFTSSQVVVGDMVLTKGGANVAINTDLTADPTIVSKYNSSVDKHAICIAVPNNDQYIQVSFSDGSPINTLKLWATTNKTDSKNLAIIYSTTADFSTGEYEAKTVSVPASNAASKALTDFSPATADKYFYARIYRKVETAVYGFTGGSGNTARIYGVKAQKGTVCIAPTALTASYTTAKGTTLSVTDANDVNNYEFYVSTESTAPTSGSTATHSVSSAKSLTITDLVAGTTYYAWARSVCGVSNKSGWTALTGSTFTTSTVTASYNLTNVTKTAGATSGIGGSDFTATFAANTDYHMPSTITVTIDGNTATVDDDYTWNQGTGTLTIPASKINGDIVVTVNSAPSAPSSAVIGGTFHYFPGENISLTVTPSGNNGPTTYQWYKGGKADGNAIEGATSATYTKNSCTFADDAGSYYCKVTCNETSIWAETNSCENYDVKILHLYVKTGKYNGDKKSAYEDLDFTKVNSTTATASVRLGANWDYCFNIADGCDHYYGNNGEMKVDNCTNWTINVNNQDCGLRSTNGAYYVFTIDYSDLTEITLTVTYPTGDQTADKVIYFDNQTVNWSTLHYRVGKVNHTQATPMIKVYGTNNLYYVTTVEYNGFAGWHIANNAGWTGSNTIYRTYTGGDEYSITYATAHDGGAVTTAAVTVTPTSSIGNGEDIGLNDNCEFFDYVRTDGMKTDAVTISPYSNGTITVNYVNTSNVATNFTSGTENLAHSVILTSITAVADVGYDASAITINGGAYSANYVVTGATTIAATFTPKTYTVTLDNQSATTAGTESVTVTYNASTNLTSAITKPTKTYYTFGGYYTATDGHGTQFIDADGNWIASVSDYTSSTKQWIHDGGITLYARWIECTGYSFHTASSGDYPWSSTCFWQVGSTHEWQIENYEIPADTKFYVGYQEDFKSSGLGSNSSVSVERAWTDDPSQTDGKWQGQMIMLPAGATVGKVGQATGALGTLIIWDNSAHKNLYVGFRPSGYVLSYSGGTRAFSQVSGTTYQTSVVTLTAANMAGTFQVNLATSSSNVPCARSHADTPSDINARKGDRVDMAVGLRGKFRIFIDNTNDNFYLHFAAVRTVSFDLQGHGDDISAWTEILHGDKISAPSPAPSEAGWVFGGWYKEAGCTNAWDFANDKVTADVNLYAKWTEAPTHTITYHLNGASWASGYTAPASYKEGIGATLPVAGNMTNVGYTFDGWYANSDLSTGGVQTAVSTSETTDKEYWAKWTENTYDVTYDANGGSGTTDSQNGHYVTLRDNGFTPPSGKAFVEWNTLSTGLGASYHEGEELELTADLALYAIWATDYDITWGDVQIGGAGDAVTPNLGGGNYTVTASVSDWTGTLTTDMISASAGVTITNVAVDNSVSPKTATITFAVSESVAGDDITLTINVPAHGEYAAKTSNEVIDIARCEGGEVNVRFLSTNKNDAGDNYANVSSGSSQLIGNGIAKMFAVGGECKLIDDTKKVGYRSDRCAIVFKLESTSSLDIYYTAPSTSRSFALYSFSSAKELENITTSDYSSKTVVTSVTASGESWTNVSAGNPSISTGVIALSGTSGGVKATYSSLSAGYYVLLSVNGEGYFYGFDADDGHGPVSPTLTWNDGELDIANDGVDKETGDADFTYTVTQNKNSLGAITYASDNTSVVTVNATTGKVHVVGAGEATITATMAESGCYNEATASYTIHVEDNCDDVAGTIATTDLGCNGILLTVSGHTAEAGVTYQWYKDNVAVTDSTRISFVAKSAGEYYVVVNNSAAGGDHCAKASTNTVVIASRSDLSATKIVDEWYVKNGRRTPDIALVQTTDATGFSVAFANAGTKIWDSNGSTTTGFGGCDFRMDDAGVIYLNGMSSAGAAPTGMTVKDTTITITAQGCGGSESVTIRLHAQAATEYKTVAFVVDGTKGGEWDAVTSGHADGTQLYEYLDSVGTGASARKFMLSERNIYKTVDEKLIREHYSQFDAILVTDDPNTSTTDGKKSYVDAFGTMIDVRPLLTMEAYVSQLDNWSCVKGDPTSPNPRQYAMRLQCKDHEIYSGLPAPADGTHVWSETIDGDEYRHVIMVDSTKSPYAGVAYNEQTGGAQKPALQGFSRAAMGDLLGLGVISDGALQAGIERQEEPAARMMILGINNKALPNALTNEGKKVIENALSYLLKTNMEDVNDCSSYFVGSESSDWSNANNWTAGLPDFETRARILAPCVVGNGDKVRVARVDLATSGTSKHKPTCNASLTIAPQGVLIVTGAVKQTVAPNFNYNDLRPTDADDLIIQANESGNGTLIFDNADGDAEATVQMYSKAYTNKGDTWNWQYIGTPFSDVTNAMTNYYNSWLYSWDVDHWTVVPRGGAVTPFAGYCITHPEAGHTYTMEGTLVATGTQEIAVGANADMVVANSWTAPIQISQLTDDDFENLLKTVYFFNTGNDPSGEGARNTSPTGDTRWEAGTYVSVPIHSSPYTGGSDSLISSMQGFFVSSPGSAGTLTLDYDRHVRPANNSKNVQSGPMHVQRRMPAASARPTVARLYVSGSRYDDKLVVLEREDFTDATDEGWDGDKWDGATVSPYLYALNDDGDEVAVLATPDMEGTLIGFRAGEDEQYTFSFYYDDEAEPLYLLDMETAVYTRVLNGNTYTFTSIDRQPHNRFILTRSYAPQTPTGWMDTAAGDKAVKFIYRDKLFIFVRGVLYDVNGKVISK